MIEAITARTCALAGSISPFGAQLWLGQDEPFIAIALLAAGSVCLLAGYLVRTEVVR